MSTQAQPGVSSTQLFDPIDHALERLRERLIDLGDGQLADYIPELSKVDPDRFGLALVSLDGNTYEAGDTDVEFTVQSISKPFVLALALSDLGLSEVTARVGVEPSGEAFNAISLDPSDGRPDNPMINAGAILTSSLVRGADHQQRLERIRSALSAFAGRELHVDRAVFDSETTAGDRNRALGYLMRNAGALTGSVEEALETYVGQCSLKVTTTDLAVMAGTLANAGRNPVTGQEVVAPAVAEHVMSIMATCGMYDASGDWLLRVGLPAKSGVAGGIVAVSPGQFGIGAFSPRLDDKGNSVRSAAALRALSEEFSLHLLHLAPATDHGVQITTVTGDAGPMVQMRGHLEFTNAERAARGLQERWDDRDRSVPDRVVVDLSEVTGGTPVALTILDALVATLVDQGVTVVSVDPQRRRLLPSVADELTSGRE